MSTSELKRTMSIALVGALAISFAPILYSVSGLNPLSGAFFRMIYALPFLVLIILFRCIDDNRTFNPRLIAIGAGIVFALDFVAYHSSVDWIGAGISTLIVNSQVLIVTLMS